MPKLDDDDDKGEGKSGGESKSIVEKMLDWINRDTDFIKAIEVFFDDNCESFGEEVDTEMKSTGGAVYMTQPKKIITHKLEYTDLYNRYLELFENKMNEFITKEGSSAEDFYFDCKRIRESTRVEDSSVKWFVEMLLASERYDTFHDVMVNHLKIKRIMKKNAPVTTGK